MSISKLFIERPVATSLMMAGVVLTGVVAYHAVAGFGSAAGRLPDHSDPDLLSGRESGSDDVVGDGAARKAVRAGAGLAADDVDQFVRQFAGHAAVQSCAQYRHSGAGSSGGDQRGGRRFCRRTCRLPPIYSKTNPADAPILTLALTSDTMPLPEVEELAETRMAQRISQLQGVGLVSISGGQRPAVRVQANPMALASYGLSLETLRTRYRSANVNAAKGIFDGPQQAWTINDNDQLQSRQSTSRSIIAYRNGAPVRLIRRGRRGRRRGEYASRQPGSIRRPRSF